MLIGIHRLILKEVSKDIRSPLYGTPRVQVLSQRAPSRDRGPFKLARRRSSHVTNEPLT